MKLSSKRREDVGFKILAVEIQKQVERSHTSHTLPKLCKDPVIPFCGFWLVSSCLMVGLSCFLGGVLFFMGLHDFCMV